MIMLMKMTDIINKISTLCLAGALAFTLASCDTDTRSEQSIVREAENEYETETNTGVEINEPTIGYEDGEYLEDGEPEGLYNYNEPYTYEERDLVIQKVRNDLQRADQSLEQLEEKIKTDGGQEAQEDLETMQQKLEESREKLSNQLGELETATEEEWERVRTQTDESLQEIERELKVMKETGVNYDEDIDNTIYNNNGANTGTGDEPGELEQ